VEDAVSQGRPEEELDPEIDVTNPNIYVAGLPRKITEDQLRIKFSQYGSIKHVNIIKDFVTSEPKGFAYILYSRLEEAKKAIEEMNRTRPFTNWEIRVEHAKRKKNDTFNANKDYHDRSDFANRAPHQYANHRGGYINSSDFTHHN
jgi:RNA recognition motif-containing protein